MKYEAVLSAWAKDALERANISQSEAADLLSAELCRYYVRMKVNRMVLNKRTISGLEVLALAKITDQPLPGFQLTAQARSLTNKLAVLESSELQMLEAAADVAIARNGRTRE